MPMEKLPPNLYLDSVKLCGNFKVFSCMLKPLFYYLGWHTRMIGMVHGAVCNTHLGFQCLEVACLSAPPVQLDFSFLAR